MVNHVILGVITLLALLEVMHAACPACPTGGVWTRWTSTTTCTKNCGFCGELVQRRTCSSHKWGCPCTGPYSRKRACPPTPCKAPNATCCGSYKVTNNKCGPLATDPTPSTVTCSQLADACWCPPRGIWSAWKSQGACSKTCGLCGKVPQKRTCLSADWGCPCTGAASRNQACPNKPCPGASPCCLKKTVITNTQSNAKVCGVQLPDDPVYAHKCKCNKCTQAMMKISSGERTSPFTSTEFASNGCYTYRAVCTSVSGYEAYIEMNNGSSGVISEISEVVADFRCASSGTGWQATTGGVTIPVNTIGCLAITCDSEPSLPEC